MKEAGRQGTPLRRGVRIGPDVVVARHIEMPPEKTLIPIPVLVPDGLHEAFDLRENHHRTVREHVRSRHAQAGLDIKPGAGSKVAQAAIRGDLTPGEEVIIQTLHLPQRMRIIRAEAGIMQLYQRVGADLSHAEIRAAMEDGQIRIEGKQGMDWDWHTTSDENHQAVVDGITLLVNTEHPLWIPEHEDPIEIDTQNDGYREALDALLVPVEHTDIPIHWVTQTRAHLYLGPKVHGLIPPQVDRRTRHVNSPFIKGGETDWPVRTEFVGPTTPEVIADHIDLNFAHAG